MGVMSGTVDLMRRAYPGTEIRDGVPMLPAAAEQMDSRMQYQRAPLHMRLDHEQLSIAVQREGPAGPIPIAVGDEVRELSPGDTETFELSPPLAAAAAAKRSRP